ncbi:MAG: hypothetical protein HYW28_04970, partial [Rhodospirillales bacterium]|nr:hypothetical protein [Rhodospirillales bacterium]
EQLNAMAAQAASSLRDAGQDLRNRLQELDSIHRKSSGRVEETADNLSHQSEMLRTATEEAVTRLARVCESLTQRSAEASVASDLNAAKLNKVMETFRELTENAGAEAAKATTTLDQATDTLRQQLHTVAGSYQQVEQGIEALSRAFRRRTGELAGVTEQALGKVAAWDQKVRAHSDALTRSTSVVAQRASQVTQALEYQTAEIRQASNEASALLEALKSRKKEAGLEDFVHQSSFIAERLQSIAVDLNRVLETSISEDEWRRFNRGEKNIFVRKMLGFREKARLNAIREKYQQDGQFREYVTRYFSEFETLLEEAKKRDQEGLLKNTFLSSDVGKVYMLLAGALGRDIQGPTT